MHLRDHLSAVRAVPQMVLEPQGQQEPVREPISSASEDSG